MKAILIYSGGLDSTTLLYEYRDSIALAVTFDYGSKHNAREIACAKENCKLLGIKHMVIPLEFIGQYFRSDLLLSGGEIPEGSYADDNMKSTVVPFRNGIMLAVAAGLAESYDLDTVLLANHAGDHAIYPDCRPEFVDAFDRAAEAGTYNGVRIVSPTATSPSATSPSAAAPSASTMPSPTPATRAAKSTAAAAGPAPNGKRPSRASTPPNMKIDPYVLRLQKTRDIGRPQPDALLPEQV